MKWSFTMVGFTESLQGVRQKVLRQFLKVISIFLLFFNAICTDDLEAISQLPDLTILETDTMCTPPGYTTLKVISLRDPDSRISIEPSLFENNVGDRFLSSTLYVSNAHENMRSIDNDAIYLDIAGPSVPVKTGVLEQDRVLAFYCYCPKLLRSWALRARYHEWPSETTIQEAASLLAQTVPVGCKGSETQWQEWRYCFIESELKLTHTLNETQIKLYILLKMVAKNILKSISKEISSYIMKNITYWLSELLPICVFREENLIKLLIASLMFLRTAIISWNFLPYYMIPTRNLLAERLDSSTKVRISKLLSSMIAEGPDFLLQCPKLRAALVTEYMAPDCLIHFSLKRNTVEQLFLLVGRMIVMKELGLETDEDNNYEISSKFLSLVLPEYMTLLLRGYSIDMMNEIFISRLSDLLW